MYPLLFNNILIEKIWGGRNLEHILKIDLPDDKMYGESWVVSDVENHYSIVQNGRFKGKSLHQLLAEYKDNLIGPGLTDKYSGSFPLLVKYLDINDKLSIQVHPDNSMAIKDGFTSGKHESWYIINASNDAKIIAGLKPGVSKKFLSADIPTDKIENYFNILSVKKGDFLNIKPGTVHATFSGKILTCEIQQNSDLTYRIYDFGRERDLQTEKGIETIIENNSVKINHTCNSDQAEPDINRSIQLTVNDYYSIYKLKIRSTYKDPVHSSFKIFSAIEGEGFIKFNSENYRIAKGMTYLIPAGLEIEIDGNLEILKTFL